MHFYERRYLTSNQLLLSTSGILSKHPFLALHFEVLRDLARLANVSDEDGAVANERTHGVYFPLLDQIMAEISQVSRSAALILHGRKTHSERTPFTGSFTPYYPAPRS